MKRPAILGVQLAILLAAGYGTARLPAQSLPTVPYGQAWSFLETENFKVIYHQGGEPLARRAATTAELVHRRLSRLLSWRPNDRTRLIILDNTDQANAMALAFPRNTILIYPAPPAGGPGNYLDWLYELLLHEYAHILQIDMATGFMAGLRSVFGRIVLPNAVQPMHQLEGLAVYAESRYSSMGRNNSALTEGTLRTASAEGNWPGIDRAGVFNPSWPWDAPYLFGGKFTKFLADSFGEGTLAQYNLAHGGLFLPFMQNRPAKRVYGGSFPALWDDWSRRSREGYRAQADSIKGRGIPGMERITVDGMHKSSLALSPDESTLVFQASDGLSHPGIIRTDLATGRSSKIHEGFVDGSIVFSPDGRSVFFGQLDWGDDGREMSCDLYRLELEGKKLTRLTRGWRARDPAPSPDGRHLYFTTTRLGQGALCRLKPGDGSADTLIPFDDSSSVSCPAVSPDGSRLAFSAWTGEGYQDIYVMTIDGRSYHPIFQDRAQDIQPRWSADGSSLYFSSDRTGVWNIFRWDLAEEKLFQATNEEGGAFWPGPGGEVLWGLSLRGQGYELTNIGIAEERTVPGPSFADNYFFAGAIEPSPASSRPYRFWKTMLPAAWLPTGFVDSGGGRLGAVVVGADDLMRHYYLAALAPGPGFRRWHYDAQYLCSALPADVYSRASDLVALRQATGDDVYCERRIEVILDVTKTLASYRRRCSIGLGYRRLRQGPEAEASPRSAGYWTGALADLAAGAAYGDAKRYRKSVSPEDGRAVSLSARLYRKALGGGVDQDWGQAEWREFLPLPMRNHVLMLAARAGTGSSAGLFVDEFSDGFRARGFDAGPGGKRKFLSSVEGRIPLCRVDRGAGTWPVFLQSLHGAVFLDASWGGEAFGKIAWQGMQRSIGAELRTDWTVFYGIGLQAGAGAAYPLEGKGNVVPYLSVTTSLEAFHGKKIH